MVSENSGSCSCLDHGPRAPNLTRERDIGVDETDGRYADVSLTRCSKCRRLWLRYQVEYEGFDRSGRWCEAIIDEEMAIAMTPEKAPEFLASVPWHRYGGSYFGHGGKRGSGRIRWGLV